MVPQKGFLLLELMGALFLVIICITLCMSGYASINHLVIQSQDIFKKTVIAQNAIESCRYRKKECAEKTVIDNFTVETRVFHDHALKNFLHIEVTVYDSEKKEDVWFSGVMTSYET